MKYCRSEGNTIFHHIPRPLVAPRYMAAGWVIIRKKNSVMISAIAVLRVFSRTVSTSLSFMRRSIFLAP